MKIVSRIFTLVIVWAVIFSAVYCQSAPIDLGREKNVLAEYFRDGKGGNLLFQKCIDDRLDAKSFCTKTHGDEFIILNAPDDTESSFDDGHGIFKMTSLGKGVYAGHQKYVKNPKFGETVFEHEYVDDDSETVTFHFIYHNDGTRLFIEPIDIEGPYAQTIEIFDGRTLRFMPTDPGSSDSFRLLPEIKKSMSVEPNRIGAYLDKHPKTNTIHVQECLGCGDAKESCKKLSTRKYTIRRDQFNSYPKPLGGNYHMGASKWKSKTEYERVTLDGIVVFHTGYTDDLYSQQVLGISVIQGDVGVFDPDEWVSPIVENTCKQKYVYYKFSKRE